MWLCGQLAPLCFWRLAGAQRVDGPAVEMLTGTVTWPQALGSPWIMVSSPRRQIPTGCGLCDDGVVLSPRQTPPWDEAPAWVQMVVPGHATTWGPQWGDLGLLLQVPTPRVASVSCLQEDSGLFRCDGQGRACILKEKFWLLV